MRISDWSSDVCSSDLQSLGSGFSRGLLSSSAPGARGWSRSHKGDERLLPRQQRLDQLRVALRLDPPAQPAGGEDRAHLVDGGIEVLVDDDVVELVVVRHLLAGRRQRSEEHTSELQPLMRIPYAVFCLKKKNKIT